VKIASQQYTTPPTVTTPALPSHHAGHDGHLARRLLSTSNMPGSMHNMPPRPQTCRGCTQASLILKHAAGSAPGRLLVVRQYGRRHPRAWRHVEGGKQARRTLLHEAHCWQWPQWCARQQRLHIPTCLSHCFAILQAVEDLCLDEDVHVHIRLAWANLHAQSLIP
jgi:hypothetical protein